jgi:hypothetical protein
VGRTVRVCSVVPAVLDGPRGVNRLPAAEIGRMASHSASKLLEGPQGPLRGVDDQTESHPTAPATLKQDRGQLRHYVTLFG